MKAAKSVIGITMGDPGGIGPEVVCKALAKLKGKARSSHSFIVFGNHAVLRKANSIAKTHLKLNVIPNFVKTHLSLTKVNLLDVTVPELGDRRIEFNDFKVGEVSKLKNSSLRTLNRHV